MNSWKTLAVALVLAGASGCDGSVGYIYYVPDGGSLSDGSTVAVDGSVDGSVTADAAVVVPDAATVDAAIDAEIVADAGVDAAIDAEVILDAGMDANIDAAEPDAAEPDAAEPDAAEPDAGPPPMETITLPRGPCRFVARFLNDGTLVCDDNGGALYVYENGDGDALTIDLDGDSTPETTFREDGTWTLIDSSALTAPAYVTEDVATGDVYHVAFRDIGGDFDTAVFRRAGGIDGPKTDFLVTLNPYVRGGITNDGTYLYAMKSPTQIGRWNLSDGLETTPLEVTGAFGEPGGLLYHNGYIYAVDWGGVLRVDATTGGAFTRFVGIEDFADELTADGEPASGSEVQIGASSLAIYGGRIHFLDNLATTSVFDEVRVRYVDDSGNLQTLDGVVSGVNQGYAIRGHAFYSMNGTLGTLPTPL